MKRMRCGSCGEDRHYLYADKGHFPTRLVAECVNCGNESDIVLAEPHLELKSRDKSLGCITIFPDEENEI